MGCHNTEDGTHQNQHSENLKSTAHCNLIIVINRAESIQQTSQKENNEVRVNFGTLVKEASLSA
jgi:hypothetical protein